MKFYKIFGLIMTIVICCLCLISSTAEQGTVANSTGSSTVYRPEATVADSTGSSTGNRPVEPKEATVADSTGSSTGNKTYEPEGVEYNPNPEPESESDVLVYGRLILPKGTTDIEEEAFWGNLSLIDVVLPEGLLRIGSKAFQNTYIRYVILPRSLEYFAPDAFDFNADGFEFYVYEGSDAAQLCVEYGLNPKVIGGNKVGVSMPTIDLKRWNQDGANLKSILEGYGYEVDLQYASNNVPTQLTQIETMIDDGAKVLVIAAIEGSSLGQALNKAAEKGVKVIAYDRLLMDNANVDYYVTFDNYKVGSIQGTYVKVALDLDSADGPFYIEFSAGDPGDRNASFFYNGAIDVLKPYIDAGKVIVKSGQTEFASVSTPTWKTEVAQRRAEDILSNLYSNGERLDAWVCSNDSIARGVTNALEANYTGNWPIITGQDCDIQNVRNIIAGKQAMSVFKDTRTLAAQIAKMVKQIINDEIVDVNDTETYNNNKKVVPSYLCDPVFCDAYNYIELLIDSGYYTEDDIGTVSPRPTLAEADIQMSETVPAGKNCTFSFSPIENATSYTASFKTGTNEIISWGSASALPNTNLTIPGYWLDNGSYSITVTASANGYRGSTSTWTFTAAGDERPAPAVEVNRTNVSSGGTCTFTVNTEDANDLRYRVGNNFYTNHINVLDDETEYATSFYNTGDYEYRFTVRRGNTWSEWSEPVIIHVSSETNLTPPVISVLSTLEEGRDLILSLSEVTGATRYGIDIYYNDGSIYSNPSLLPNEISSIVIPGYNIAAGAYQLSAYSYDGNKYSDTTYKSITILDADRPDAPTVEPPVNTTVASNDSVTFKINTTGADKVAVRYFIPGNSQNASYQTKTVGNGQNETTWSFLVNGSDSWKYSFSARKDGVWSFWSSPITITVEENGGATPSSLTIVTGGTAGTYFAYGTVLAYYISNNSDVSMTAVAGTGSADNIDGLDINDAQLGFVQNDIAYYALNGIRFERYKGRPVTSFTALAALYTETIQLVTCNPDIKSVSDLRGKNVSVGSSGSGVYFNAMDFLAAYDMTVADINPQYLSFGDSAEALKDGKIDAAFVVASAPTPAVTDLFASKATYLISLDAAHIMALQEISPVYTESIIPAGTYANQSEDAVTVGVKATIIANNHVSDAQAYTIVKTIFEGKNAITAMHAKGAQLNLVNASSCGLPYHAGAERYYAEQGIEVNMNH